MQPLGTAGSFTPVRGRTSQHIAGFIYVTTAVRSIVTAAVHRGFSSGLHRPKPGHPSP